MTVTTELSKFADLVHKMRMAQKHYFKTRTGQALAIAKRLEAEVDVRCQTIAQVRPVDQIPSSLFGDDRPTSSALTNGK